MRAFRVLGLLVVVAGIGLGCGLPSRNNPYDPNGAPALRVVTLPPQADCALDAPSDAWSEVSAASRGACLALDARADASAGMRWYVVGTSGRAVELTTGSGGGLTDSGNGLAILDNTFLRTLPVQSLVRFRVLSHAHGSHFADVFFALTNAAPVAIGDGARTLPVAGYPWSPASTYDVVLDGSHSTDDDDDPLTYRWIFPDGVAISAPGTSIAHHTIPSTAGTTIAYLVANDGIADSRPAPVVVTVGDPPVWTGAGAPGNGSAISRIDSVHASWPLPPLGMGRQYIGADDALLAGGPAPRIAEISWDGFSAPALKLYTYPFHAVLGSQIDLDIGAFAVAPDASGTRVWIYSDSATSGTTLQAYDLDPAGTSLVAGPFHDQLPSSPASSFRVVPAAGGGVWFAQTPGSHLGYDDGGATEVVTTTSNGRLVQDLAARPGSDELWTIERTGISGLDDAVLSIYRPSAPPERIPVTGEPTALAWLDDQTLWLAGFDDGVRLLDEELLRAGATIDQATLAHAVLPGHVERLLPDPHLGDTWARTSDPAVFRVSRFGQLTPYQSTLTPTHVGPDGAIWFVDPGYNPGRGEVPSDDGVLFRLPNLDYTTYAYAVDADGSVWSWNDALRQLERTATDGTRIRRLVKSRMAAGGAAVPLPEALTLAIDPDGTHAWMEVTDPAWPNGLWRMSLAGGVAEPDPGLVLDSAALAASGIYTLKLRPSAPLPGAAPFAWYSDSAITGIHIGTLGADGTLTPATTLGANEQQLYVAVSPVSNRLCAATIEHGASNEIVRIRWIDPAGNVVMPAPYTAFAQGTRLGGVSTTHDAAGAEYCYAVLHSPASGGVTDCSALGSAVLGAWDTNGVLVRSHNVPIGDMNVGLLAGPALRALSENTVWIAAKTCTPAGHDALVRADFDPGTGAWSTQELPTWPEATFAPR